MFAPHTIPIPLPSAPEWKQEVISIPKIKSYHIEVQGDALYLSQEVGRHIRDGWVPFGQPAPFPCNQYRDGVAFMQALVKYEEEE